MPFMSEQTSLGEIDIELSAGHQEATVDVEIYTNLNLTASIYQPAQPNDQFKVVLHDRSNPHEKQVLRQHHPTAVEAIQTVSTFMRMDELTTAELSNAVTEASASKVTPLSIMLPSEDGTGCDDCGHSIPTLYGHLLWNSEGRPTDARIVYSDGHMGGETIEGEYGWVRRSFLRLLKKVATEYPQVAENPSFITFRDQFQD